MPKKRQPIKPMQLPLGQEYAYQVILLRLNKQYKQKLKECLSPVVVEMSKEATATNLPTGEVRQDAMGWRDNLSQAMARLAREMVTPTNRAIREMTRVGPATNQFNKTQWQRLIRSQYGVDPTKENPDKYNALLNNWSRQNSLLIKDIPFKTSSQIAKAVSEALVKGTVQQEVASEIFDIMSERTEVQDSRAKLIARDQVSKLNGNLTKERQLDLGVEGYIWRTVGDERVREEHEDNDGQFFTWDSPPMTGHPGEDVQCRCWAEPVLPDFVSYQAELLEEVE